MKFASVRKAARVLLALMRLAFCCNLLALPLVPAMARAKYVDTWLYQELLWDSSLVWQEPRAVALMLFLFFAGICTAVILWQGCRVLGTVLLETPFSIENAVSLRRAAAAAFVIAAAALVRVAWGVWFYGSIRPLLTYNALFVPIFAMFGLLCLVMSALFRQAAELKAEQDLTI